MCCFALSVCFSGVDKLTKLMPVLLPCLASLLQMWPLVFPLVFLYLPFPFLCLARKPKVCERPSPSPEGVEKMGLVGVSAVSQFTHCWFAP